MTNIFNKLQEKFDHIFVLTLSSRLDMRDAILNQLKNIGYDQNIYSNLELFYATPFPYNKTIAIELNESLNCRFSFPNEFDCARNHYSIVKRSFDLGYEHILIMEDDIRFLKDQNKFIEYLDAIPEDFDILQFSCYCKNEKLDKYLNCEDLWFKHDDVGCWTTAMYALSRKGMQYYLTFMNKQFSVADMPLYVAPVNNKIVNTYLSKIPLALQADVKLSGSDININNAGSINYNSNRYEFNINKDDYFTYKIKQ